MAELVQIGMLLAACGKGEPGEPENPWDPCPSCFYQTSVFLCFHKKNGGGEFRDYSADTQPGKQTMQMRLQNILLAPPPQPLPFTHSVIEDCVKLHAMSKAESVLKQQVAHSERLQDDIQAASAEVDSACNVRQDWWEFPYGEP